MGTARWPLYMCGSVPHTPQWVGRRRAPSRGGPDSGKLAISSVPGAVSTAARIMPGEQAVAYEPATGGAAISCAGAGARPRIPTR
jgi:hypothetical protein